MNTLLFIFSSPSRREYAFSAVGSGCITGKQFEVGSWHVGVVFNRRPCEVKKKKKYEAMTHINIWMGKKGWLGRIMRNYICPPTGLVGIMSSVSNFFKSLLHLYESNSSLVLHLVFPLVYPLPDLALIFSFPFFLRIKLMGSMIGLSHHVFHRGKVGLHDLLCKIACQLFLFLGFVF